MRKAILFIIISTLIISPLSSCAFTRYNFNGKPLDIESNLYYYGQRYYDPNIGRFTQPDPVANYLTNPEQMKKATGMDLQKFLENPQNLNSYSYTINNPVKYTDPNGESPLAFAAAGVAVSTVWASPNLFNYFKAVFSGNFNEADKQTGPILFKEVVGLAGGVLLGIGAQAVAALIGTGAAIGPVAVQVAQKVNNLSKLDKLEQVPSATEKLNIVSKQIGMSVNNILKIANESKLIFTDLRIDNLGNINVFFQNPINTVKFVRITLDPTLNRIISAGTTRVNQVQNWINNGDIVNFIPK